MSTTGKEFVEFWGWVVSKGLMNENTARSLGAASRQVLSIDDDWESRDVSAIDVEDTLRRFKNIRQKDFKPESLNAYERRFQQALGLYLEYKRDPANWKFVGQEGSSRRARGGKVNSSSEEQGIYDFVGGATGDAIPPVSLMEYPFPLREACIVKLRLPSDLKVSEVERLSAFMKTLAIDFSVSKGN